MNKLQTLALALMSTPVLLMSACSKNNDNTVAPAATIKTNTVADLDGSKGAVYYSLAGNSVVTGADTTGTKWDIKFSGTGIFVNGGSSGTGTAQAQVVSSTFADLTTAPTSGYKADATGAAAITGWYTYTATTAPQHAILMVPGKIIVVKTSAGNYAKIEMKSYYKGNPDTTTPAFADLTTRPASRFYTFRYSYQANGTTSLQ
ncbi:heme-binding HmuY-like protein [Mucilaginibacter oryzae]|uniref:Heme-binding HmuY-like protein n=1 Tax=Mucilaginibacter oryzae TaxID=468058 RepID=A0A316HG41_9SPHI|nr:HmuY family protein [Mucilaginibacter oryzae]PWK79143.1 heme-binding HmuY-like protein [Mucilaginibacter oryzae]